MNNLIRVFDGALSDEQCDYLIDKFESNPDLQEKQVNGEGKTLTRMSLMGDTPFKDDLQYLQFVFLTAVNEYKKSCGVENFQFPDEYGMEDFRIKKYNPGGDDSFPKHIDVMNLEMAARFLVMFIYLTDNNKGETEIDCGEDLFLSPCKKGSVLLFPPMWPWKHTGREPVDTPKYIVGSYLHYVK
jgi:hypothetical protein